MVVLDYRGGQALDSARQGVPSVQTKTKHDRNPDLEIRKPLARGVRSFRCPFHCDEREETMEVKLMGMVCKRGELFVNIGEWTAGWQGFSTRIAS